MLKSKFIFSAMLLMLYGTAKAQELDMVPAPKVQQSQKQEEVPQNSKVDGIAFIAPTNSVNMGKSASEVVITPKEKLEFKQNGEVEEALLKEDGTPFSGATVVTDEEGRDITYFYRNGRRSGVALSHFEDGKVELEITYSKGYKSGEEILFYENGYPKYKKTYRKNVLNGEEILFYENGKPERRNMYVNGLLDGEISYFDRNGNLVKIENYKSGKKDGIERIIENNQLLEENNYVAGELNGITKKYNRERMLEEIEYKNGKRNGITKRYLDDGGWDEIPYKDNMIEGVAKNYYPTKRLASMTQYAVNMKNGPSEKYYQSGSLQQADNYKNNVQEGISRMFDESGNLLSVSYYAGGIELAKEDLLNDAEIKKIYDAVKADKLNTVLNNKQLWYPVLWLGISTNSLKILDELDKRMKMYATNIEDISAYQSNLVRFSEQNRRLFFGLTPLSYAVNMASPVEILQRFASGQDSVEMKNPRGGYAIIEAVRLNNYDLVQYLLSHHADVKKVYDDGNTILLYAVKEKVRNDIIAALIKAGADVNATDSSGYSLLMLAVRDNNLELLKVLLDNYADFSGKTPDGKNILSFALENNASKEVLEQLLIKGADVNATDEDGSVLILRALAAGKEDVAKLFMQYGADINAENANHDTVLTYVLENKTGDDFVADIFTHSLDVKNNLPKYNKPLWKILAEQNKIDLLKIVLQNMGGGAVADANGEIPVVYAMDNSENQKLKEVIFAALNEAVLKSHPEFLWKAVKDKKFDLYKELLQKKSSVNVTDENGDSLLLYLIKNEYPFEYITELENYAELDYMAKDATGKTALQIAIEADNTALVENLLAHGVSPNSVNNEGKSFIETLDGNQEKITELLWNAGSKDMVTPDNINLLLRIAVTNLNVKWLEFLLNENPDVAYKDENGEYAQMYLADALEKHSELPQAEILNKLETCFTLLKEKGADINWQNNNGETLLIKLSKAKSQYYPLIADLFVRLGADVAKKDQYNKTAKDYAVEYLPDI